MAEKIRVIHYINQFYAGMGGEDTASVGISVKEEPVGPGLLLRGLLGDSRTGIFVCAHRMHPDWRLILIK